MWRRSMNLKSLGKGPLYTDERFSFLPVIYRETYTRFLTYV